MKLSLPQLKIKGPIDWFAVTLLAITFGLLFFFVIVVYGVTSISDSDGNLITGSFVNIPNSGAFFIPLIFVGIFSVLIALYFWKRKS